MATAVALLLAVGILAATALRRNPGAPALRVEITTPPTADPVSLAISPDGQKVVFVATSGGGRSQL